VEKSKLAQSEMKAEYLKVVAKLDAAVKKHAESEHALKSEKKSKSGGGEGL
jgi:hypothetical protein